jgi:hypothetical protein
MELPPYEVVVENVRKVMSSLDDVGRWYRNRKVDDEVPPEIHQKAVLVAKFFSMDPNELLGNTPVIQDTPSTTMRVSTG